MGKKVKIFNPATGETKIVDESELGAYGAQTMPKDGTMGGSLSPANATLEPLTSTEEPKKMGILEGILQPFIRTGKTILGTPIEGARAFTLGNQRSALDENTKQLSEITAKLQTTKDPEVKKVLMAESKKLTTEATKLKEKMSAVTNFQNPFLNSEDFKKIDEDPRGFVTQQVKDSANIASYGIPFGKAGFIGSKFIAPGAAIGATQAATTPEAGLNWETADEVAKGALTGGVTGVATQVGSKLLGGILNKTGAISPTLEKGAQLIEEGQRQIKLKPSVWGASGEKSINETLTRWGVKGAPEQQYAMLEPTMNKIEAKIQEVIAANPGITIGKEEIKQAFMKNLATSIRSKELLTKQAEAEIDSYLNTLLKASGGKGKFTNIDLGKSRELKKLVNEDYQGVQRAIDNGSTLTPRQRVIAAAWDSLDDAVKKASPEVKALLKDESNLYKAAPSLSAGRFNPPTERFLGTSIPGPVENAGKSALVDVLRGASKKTAGVSAVARGADAVTSNPIISQVLQQSAVRLPQVLSNNDQVPDNENQNNDTQNLQSTTTVPQQTATATGYSLQQLGQAYAQALQAGDKASAEQLKNMYDLEDKFQKTQGGGAQKLTQRQAMFQSAAGSAQHALDLLEQGKVAVGPASGPLQDVLSKGGFASDTQNDYSATIALARSALLNAFLGGNIPPSEYRRISDGIPSTTDPTPKAKQKLKTFIRELERYVGTNVQESGYGTYDGSLSNY